MFNYYPKNFKANGCGGHRTANVATSVRGFVTAEEYESGAVKEVIEEACASVNVNAMLGETRPTSFFGQDFKEIRSRCLAEGSLFEDPEFPAIDHSLYYTKKPEKPITWLRPGDICEDPQLFVKDYSRFDVQQGELGDCWLLAAVSNLTLNRQLFFQVVPDDQSFDEDYAGVFHFRFWQYGRWVDVVIDDRLPTREGKLVFLHSSKNREFWSALLEKAYAKLNGSYEFLDGGFIGEAMEDFTGGVTEMYDIAELPPNFFTILLKAYERNSLSGCSFERAANDSKKNGLIAGHAYSITKVKYIETPGRAGKIPLLRLRNPWGDENEWNGPWSDKSPEWRSIPESEKKEMGLTFDHDGEFWMFFDDFIEQFSTVEICYWNPNSLDPEECPEGCTKKWEMSAFNGEWVRGVTAGGCRKFFETFWKNPQCIVTLKDVDEEDDEDKCTIIVNLMQKNRRHQGLTYLKTGFYIYRLPDDAPKPLDLEFFKYNAYVGRTQDSTDLRGVSARFKLDPGSYVIVPSTFYPNEEGEFLLRVFSEKGINMAENHKDIGMGDIDDRVNEISPNPKPDNRLAGDDGGVEGKGKGEGTGEGEGKGKGKGEGEEKVKIGLPEGEGEPEEEGERQGEGEGKGDTEGKQKEEGKGDGGKEEHKAKEKEEEKVKTKAKGKGMK